MGKKRADHCRLRLFPASQIGVGLVLAAFFGACGDNSGGTTVVVPSAGQIVPDAAGADPPSDTQSAATDTGNASDLPAPSELPTPDVFACPSDKPVVCEPPKSCWAVGTDCGSLHTDPDGTLVACQLGEKGFLDASNALVCCANDAPTWCPPTATYGGGCWPAGSDCGSLTQCGKGFDLCPTGQVGACGGDGELHCCGGQTPDFCAPNGVHLGFCVASNTDCQTARSCGTGAPAACPNGRTSHCWATDAVICCGGDTPDFCASNATLGFDGGCFAAGANCDTLSQAPDGTWDLCLTTQSVGQSAEGALVCCTAQKTCPVGAGIAGDYDGASCLPLDANCDSLTAKADGTGWDLCPDGAAFGLDADGTLRCCQGDSPSFCPPGPLLPDGDAAWALSLASYPPTPAGPNADCAGQCTFNTYCGPINGTGFRCKASGATPCNQCTANNAFGDLQVPYPGGCQAADVACDTLHLCGGAWLPCPTGNCFCSDGALQFPW